MGFVLLLSSAQGFKSARRQLGLFYLQAGGEACNRSFSRLLMMMRSNALGQKKPEPLLPLLD